MTDDRFTLRLRAAETEEIPDPAFVDRLYGELAAELGFRPSAALRHVAVPRAKERAWRRRLTVLLAAALLVSLALGALLVGAALVRQDRADDLLSMIMEEGRISIATSREHPQVTSPNGASQGFDIDVADRIGARMGITVDIAALEASELLARASAWDMALAPSALTSEQEIAYRLVEPVYAWPIALLVTADSPATDLAMLAGARIGATDGSIGARWVATGVGASSDWPPVPAGVRSVSVGTDLECLDLLEAGDVDACVTSTLGPADLDIRPSFRALDPILLEERGPIVRRDGPDPDRLVSELRRIVGELRADGTLADLSRRRFGTDLTMPNP